MSEPELVNFLAALPGSEFDQWQACRSDLGQWYSASAFPAFRLKRFGFDPIPAELGFTANQLGWLEFQFLQHHTTQAIPAPTPSPAPTPRHQERRKHPRKAMKLQVVLISDEAAFRTFTKNLSLGGMAVEKAVPQKFLGSQCSIFLSEPGSSRKFVFTGVILAEESGESAPRHRITFKDVEPISLQALELWLENGEVRKAA